MYTHMLRRRSTWAEIHLYNAFLAQARYLGSNVEVGIHFDNAFLLQARYLSSNAEVEIFCRSPYSYPLVCLLLRIEVYRVRGVSSLLTS